MTDTSRLVKMKVTNLGCIGGDGCEIALDSTLCLVGENNSGKSTILRAYELAVGSERFEPKTDLCNRANNEPATVEIWVHVPEGTPNIAERWKERVGELRLVRSKWEWREETKWTKIRHTWNPELGEYSTDDTASGLDTVFSSRLPVPFRIGSLEDPEQEHRKLLSLILQPIADKIRGQMQNPESELRESITAVSDLTRQPVTEEQERLDVVKEELNQSHNLIFPDLNMDFDIGIGDLDFDPLQMLLKNSKLKFTDWTDEVSWKQQGTGSQRALFWTMLQVRSRLKSIADLEIQRQKRISEHRKQILKLEKDAEKAKKEETKRKKAEEIDAINELIQRLEEPGPEHDEDENGDDFTLPGYMLLIDEPEIGLHPNAIRAASRYLYSLTEDRTWQVMLATHSPLFIDPLQDHTTIVRLKRSQANPTPRTYKSDSVTFDNNEKENLKILNMFDQGIAEMFFGQFPIVIEGDTEFAVFQQIINDFPDVFPTSKRPLLVRARGKYTFLPILKILEEFKIPFALLHDTDRPLRRDDTKNGMWTANNTIYETVKRIRENHQRVVHRVSVPGFELQYFPLVRNKDGVIVETDNKEKPWKAVKTINESAEIKEGIKDLLLELVDPDSVETQVEEPYTENLLNLVQTWARTHSPDDRRFFPPE